MYIFNRLFIISNIDIYSTADTYIHFFFCKAAQGEENLAGNEETSHEDPPILTPEEQIQRPFTPPASDANQPIPHSPLHPSFPLPSPLHHPVSLPLSASLPLPPSLSLPTSLSLSSPLSVPLGHPTSIGLGPSQPLHNS